MSTLQVGQTLWFVPSSRYGQPREVQVTKVGRKWAEIEGGRERIDLATWDADGRGYSSPGQCYANREAWEERKAAGAAWRALYDGMRGVYGCPAGLTADRIREAASLLGIDILKDGETA